MITSSILWMKFNCILVHKSKTSIEMIFTSKLRNIMIVHEKFSKTQYGGPTAETLTVLEIQRLNRSRVAWMMLIFIDFSIIRCFDARCAFNIIYIASKIIRQILAFKNCVCLWSQSSPWWDIYSYWFTDFSSEDSAVNAVPRYQAQV